MKLVKKLKSKEFWTGVGIAVGAGALGVAGAVIYGKVKDNKNEEKNEDFIITIDDKEEIVTIESDEEEKNEEIEENEKV